MGKKIASFLMLILSDMMVLLISFVLAYFIRSEVFPHIYSKFKIVPLYSLAYYLSHAYMALVYIAVFAYERLYTKRYPFWEEVKVLSKSTTISFALIMIMVFLTRKQTQLSRTIITTTWLIGLLLFPASRFLIKLLMTRMNIWRKNLLILGTDILGSVVLDNINKNPTLGYDTVGFIEHNPGKLGKEIQGVKVLGHISKLKDILQSHTSKDIVIAIPELTREELLQTLSTCEDFCETIWVVPRLGDIITSGIEIESLGQVWALNIKKNLSKPWNILAKTVFDICVTVIALPILLPLFAAVAVSIKLDSPGPVIFIQERLGRRQKLFRLFKFRSMYINSAKRLEECLKNNREASQEWRKYKKLKQSDPRVTRVGKIIRKYSLDELPQLFNVLQGKMSLVGPRPYLLEELKEKESFLKIMTKVKPGITGLWQSSGRSELSFEERMALDKYYINNWSLWLDITIVLKSIKVLFSKKGAY
jgi:Undecaprenyl-phosphate galactose phosphotransferase WbaP